MKNLHLIILSCFVLQAADASTIFTDNFNSYSGGNFNGGQYQSDLVVAYGGNEAGWTHTGGNAIHAVDLANVYGSSSNPSNFAAMIWQDNTLTLNSGIAGSNVLGQTYQVDFQASAAVYQASSQATSATDGLMIEILRGNNSILDSFTYLPGAWTGNMAFSSAEFSYTGDGIDGNVRIEIAAADPNSGHFAGAIDNLSVSTVPEPASIVLISIGFLGFAAKHRKTIKNI